jgi:hypothetical protein
MDNIPLFTAWTTGETEPDILFNGQPWKDAVILENEDASWIDRRTSIGPPPFFPAKDNARSFTLITGSLMTDFRF